MDENPSILEGKNNTTSCSLHYLCAVFINNYLNQIVLH